MGGLPEKMELKLIEPLKELFKDEVRQLGRELDLPANFIERHPFPGPGLAIRIPGEITLEKLDILRKADTIFINELKNRDLYQHIWQAFAVLLPVNTVGVMGDARTYEFVCALRAVTSTDGMTADFYHFKMNDLADITNRIINEVEGINRVVYETTSKPQPFLLIRSSIEILLKDLTEKQIRFLCSLKAFLYTSTCLSIVFFE